MKILTRTLQILAILGAVASGYFYFLTGSLSNKTNAQLLETSSELKFERSKSNTISKKLAEREAEQEANEARLADARAEIASLTAKFNQLQRENLRFANLRETHQIAEEKLQNENARLVEELGELGELRANSIAKEQMASYQTKIAQLERQVLSLQQTQSAKNTAVSSTVERVPANPSLTGYILTVGKNASFVVLDIGYSDGVRLKTEFMIQHADTPIAKIQITEVKGNLSIARILPNSITKTPQPGDRVASFN